MTENEIAKAIVDAAYKVHNGLGPGLLESVYETAMEWELKNAGLSVTRQHPISITYSGLHIRTAFIADLIVENQVIIELKSVEAIAPVHKRQLLTYLKLSNKRLGLLINFNVVLVKDGITRVANGMPT